MKFTNPTKSDFKTFFDRDFPYTTNTNDLSKVRDKDIDKAIAEANIQINQELFGNQAEFTSAFLYLTAHYLCNDLLAASQGVNSTFSWLTSSKSVGAVSEGFVIPEMVQNSPYLSFLASTRYGVKYLSIIIPRILGNIQSLAGTTTFA